MSLSDRTSGKMSFSSTSFPVKEPQVIKACFRPHRHSPITDGAFYAGSPGITVKLKIAEQKGLLAPVRFSATNAALFLILPG